MLSNKNGPACLVVNLNGDDPYPDSDGGYHVIDTDYVSYAILYSCQEKFWGWYSEDYFWVLGRETSMSDRDLERIREIVLNRIPGYDYDGNTDKTRQCSSCPYDDMPTIDDSDDEDGDRPKLLQ